MAVGRTSKGGRTIDGSVARILDANANRAREAARVLEDYARFALDDAGFSRQAKDIRHGLVAVLEQAGLANVVRNRDILEDVGRNIQTEREYRRESTADVVIAAAARLSEALRVLEEYGKTVDAGIGRAFEQLRYRGYELERRMRIGLEAARRFGHVRLYVLLTESLCSGDWLETARAALDGGADCVQLREKTLPDGELLTRARLLVALCRERGALFIVNDRADLALAAQADGLHVGQEDLPVAEARRVLGPGPLIGTSTHTPEQVRTAVAQAPDYIAVGPMFASGTKPLSHVPGPALVEAARALTSLPLVAIGGITPENAPQVVQAGARCICVCSAVISQPDPREAARRLKDTMSIAEPALEPKKDTHAAG